MYFIIGEDKAKGTLDVFDTDDFSLETLKREDVIAFLSKTKPEYRFCYDRKVIKNRNFALLAETKESSANILVLKKSTDKRVSLTVDIPNEMDISLSVSGGIITVKVKSATLIYEATFDRDLNVKDKGSYRLRG